MKAVKKISVIVPICNAGEYLYRCVNSILTQSYSELEVILVDDGSTDGSEKICDFYDKTEKRIKVIHQRNSGSAKARKTGLNEAEGEYIIFVDADDYMEPDLCEKMLNRILALDVDFVHADYIENDYKQINNIKNPAIYRDLTMQERIDILKINVFKMSVLEVKDKNLILPSLWSKIYKKEFVKEWYNKIPDSQSFGEDLICLCHMIMNCNSMAVIDDAYYHYSLRENSLSHTRDLEKIVNISGLYKNLQTVFEGYNCRDCIIEELKQYYEFGIFSLIELMESSMFHINRYYYGSMEKLRGKKIVLYGAGKVGRDYYDQLCRYRDIAIEAWVDKEHEQKKIDYYRVTGLDMIEKSDFDYILAAILDENIRKEIRNNLMTLGVDSDKILWDAPMKNYLE